MPLTRIDSAFLDLDGLGGIDFDVQNSVPTFKVEAVNHRVGIGHNSPAYKLDVVGDINISSGSNFLVAGSQISTANVAEDSSYLYYTNARVDARIALQDLDLSTKSTSDLAEGTNLYYTNARVDARIALQDLDLSTKSTSDLAEGTNLYYTNARARSSISVTDSGGDGSLSYNSSTGVITYTGPNATSVRTHFSGGSGISITSGSIAIVDSVGLSGTPTAPTAAAGTNTTQIATTAFVSTGLANLVDSAPGALDTLNELAAALGDDASFSTTITNSIATKLSLAGGQMTGNITFSGSQTVDGRDVSADGSKLDGIESGATADLTAAEILNLLKTVDTNTSGLNADTLDGIQASNFLKSNENDSFEGDTLTFSSNVSDPVILIKGTGPNFITFASDGAGTVDSDSINLVYRSTPNTLGFERSTDGATLFSIDADNARATFGENIVVAGTVDGRDLAVDGTKLDGIEAGATGDQTASEILTAIKTVDGSGSGLDADTVDGIQGASFLRSDANDTATGSITFSADTNISNQKYIGYNASYNYKPRITGGIGTRSEVISAANLLLHADTDGSGTAEFLSIRAGGGTANELKIVSKTVAAGQSSSALTYNGGQVWHAGNDGSGSGLDADTLDGAQPSVSAGNNTIVKRHSSGYIFANYFNTTPNDVSSGVTKVCVETGNDGYIRHGTAAAVRTFLGVESGATADQTAAEILTAIKTVDGSGSGLDADTLDGIGSGSFLRSDADDTFSRDLISNARNRGIFGAYDSTKTDHIWSMGTAYRNHASGTNFGNLYGIAYKHTNNSTGGNMGGGHQMVWCQNGSPRGAIGNDYVWHTSGMRVGSSNHTVWHAGNDGAGSGLDADLLDGIGSGSFLRSDADDTMTGALTITVDNKANGALRINANQTTPVNDFYFAQEIVSTLSGSTTFTGDKEQGGIYMDINSTATGGGTSHEHRAYGMYIDLDVTGDADIAYGIFADSTVTPTTGTVTNVTGVYGRAEDNGGAGSVSTVIGVRGEAHSDNSNSDINNVYAGYFRCSNAADTGNISEAVAVYGEIEIAASSGDHYGTSYVFRAEYDNNDTATAQTNTTYLYYGNYAGIQPTTAYGVYIIDDVKNYFAGDVGIGIAAPAEKLDVVGVIKSSVGVKAPYFEITGGGKIADATGNYGSIKVTGGDTTSYGGYAIEGGAVFMRHNSNGTFGLYDDGNNHWAIKHTPNAATSLYYDGTAKIITTSAGGSIEGSLTVDSDILPDTDNSGNVGTSTLTFANGRFTNFQVDSTLTVRAAIDLADGDVIRMGSSDDWTISRNSNNWTYINDIGNGIIFQDNGTNKMRLEDSGIFRPESDGGGSVGTSAVRWANGYFDAMDITGTINVRGAVDLADNDILRLGSGDDAELFCNGSHLYLDLNSGIGNFYIRDGSTTRYTFNDNGSFTATGNVTAYSDIKLKENIEPIANPLDKVNQINGVTFDRIDTPELGRQMGVIAQDVEKVCPELVSTDDEGTKSVAYGNMVGLLIEAIKDQQKQIDELKAKLEEK